jgi:hypothetical protein
MPIHSELLSDFQIRESLMVQQYNAAAFGHLLRCSVRSHPLLQHLALLGFQIHTGVQ